MHEIDTFIFTLQPRFTVKSTKYAARVAIDAGFLLQSGVPMGTNTHTKPCACMWKVREAR